MGWRRGSCRCTRGDREEACSRPVQGLMNIILASVHVQGEGDMCPFLPMLRTLKETVQTLKEQFNKDENSVVSMESRVKFPRSGVLTFKMFIKIKGQKAQRWFEKTSDSFYKLKCSLWC